MFLCWRQFCHLQPPTGENNKRYRVIDTLPGGNHFCPHGSKSAALLALGRPEPYGTHCQIISEYDTRSIASLLLRFFT